MDKTKKDLQLMQTAPPPAITFQPDIVVEQATAAAQTLRKVIENKPKKVTINGEQYLEFEDWQTLGRFYGYTVAATETNEIWRDGKLIGFTAKAVVYQHGQIVSNAEASCMQDEKNWKDRPEFMLKSMAQTRACAKALRNVLAWVAVLAGYKPTPAEEMDGVGKADQATTFSNKSNSNQGERLATSKQLEFIEKTFKWNKIDIKAFTDVYKPLEELTIGEAKKMLDVLFDKTKTPTLDDVLALFGMDESSQIANEVDDGLANAEPSG